MINLKPIFAFVITIILAIATQGERTTVADAERANNQPLTHEPLVPEPLANR